MEGNRLTPLTCLVGIIRRIDFREKDVLLPDKQTAMGVGAKLIQAVEGEDLLVIPGLRAEELTATA